MARARIWLDTHDPAPIVPATRTRTPVELDERRQELEAILATAPADQRGLITQLRAEGTLPYDNVNELLADALAAQGDRQRWILEHWPHVVEYAQLRAAIEAAGPNVDELLSALDSDRPSRRSPGRSTAANPGSIESPPRWRHRQASIPTPSASSAPRRAPGTLGHQRAGPLGSGAWDPDQAAERELLRVAIEERSHTVEDASPVQDRLGLGVEV